MLFKITLFSWCVNIYTVSFALFHFPITVYIQWYSVLVSGAQHSGETILHFTGCPLVFPVPTGPCAVTTVVPSLLPVGQVASLRPFCKRHSVLQLVLGLVLLRRADVRWSPTVVWISISLSRSDAERLGFIFDLAEFFILFFWTVVHSWWELWMPLQRLLNLVFRTTDQLTK